MKQQFLEPHQARDRDPTQGENLLADVIEYCYGRGVNTVIGIVGELNTRRVPSPDSGDWSAETFMREMARLGE